MLDITSSLLFVLRLRQVHRFVSSMGSNTAAVLVFFSSRK